MYLKNSLKNLKKTYQTRQDKKTRDKNIKYYLTRILKEHNCFISDIDYFLRDLENNVQNNVYIAKLQRHPSIQFLTTISKETLKKVPTARTHAYVLYANRHYD